MEISFLVNLVSKLFTEMVRQATTKSGPSPASPKPTANGSSPHITRSRGGKPVGKGAPVPVVTPEDTRHEKRRALKTKRAATDSPDDGNLGDVGTSASKKLKRQALRKTGRTFKSKHATVDPRESPIEVIPLGASGSKDSGQQGQTRDDNQTPAASEHLRAKLAEIEELKAKLSAYENVTVDTPKTAEIKQLKATLAKRKKSKTRLIAKSLLTDMGDHVAGMDHHDAATDHSAAAMNANPHGGSEINFEAHDSHVLEDMITTGAAVFGALKTMSKLQSIVEGSIICLAINERGVHTFEFMQVGIMVGANLRALTHIGTSRCPSEFEFNTPQMALAPSTNWYFILEKQSLSELALMTRLSGSFQMSGQCQLIPVDITDKEVLRVFYEKGDDAVLTSAIASKSTQSNGPPPTPAPHGSSTWSEEIHLQERALITKADAHLYHEVSKDSIKRSQDLMKANPDMRGDKTFQQSKTADSISNKGMNLTVVEIFSISPHDASRRLQHELSGRYFRVRKTYMPLYVLVKLAGDWSFPFGAQGMFYFWDLVPEFGERQSDLLVMLQIQTMASECVSKITPEFTAMAANHRKQLMDKFNIASAKTIMLNLVYAIALVYDAKFKFQSAMIQNVRNLFDYLEAQTLGNLTPKNVEFIKISMVLLSVAWEKIRSDMSVRGRSETSAILDKFKELPDLSTTGLIHETKVQLQMEDNKSSIKLLRDGLNVDETTQRDSPTDTKKKPLSKLDDNPKKDKDKKRKRKEALSESKESDKPSKAVVDETESHIKTAGLCLHACSTAGCHKAGCAWNHNLATANARQIARVSELLGHRNLQPSAEFTSIRPADNAN